MIFFRMSLNRLGEIFLLPLIILAIGFVTFYTYDIRISSDLGWHMNTALDLLGGKGFVPSDIAPVFNKGPLWPFIISLSYLVNGISPWSAFWAVRIFAILNPVLIYFLGKRFFNKWIGCFAALMVLSSYSMNFWSYRHLDAVWPFFALSSIFVGFSALEKRSYGHFLLCGCLMGASYLVKQTAILLFPLYILLLMVVKDFRNRQNLYGILIYCSILTVIICPWLFYVYSETDNLKLAILGSGSNQSEVNNINFDAIKMINNYLLGLAKYFFGGNNSLASNFLLTPLFVLSWIFTVFRSLKKEKSSIFFILCFILISPYISIVGLKDLRLGQLLFFLFLSYLVTAHFCVVLMELAVGRLEIDNIRGYKKAFLLVACIFFIIFLQIFYPYKRDKGNIEFLKQSFAYKLGTNCDLERRIVGNFGKSPELAGIWIEKNIPAGSRLMVSKPSEGKGIYFYSGGDYPIYEMPVIQSNRECQAPMEKKDLDAVIFMSAWTSKVDPRNKLYVLAEDDLHVAIKDLGIDYIIVNKRRNYLSKYFSSNTGFSLIKTFADGEIKIYRVVATEQTQPFKPMVSMNLISYLNRLRKEDPSHLDWYHEQFFKPLLGLDRRQIDVLRKLSKKKNSRFNVVRNSQIY